MEQYNRQGQDNMQGQGYPQNGYGMPAQPAAPAYPQQGTPVQPAAPAYPQQGAPAQPAAPAYPQQGVPMQSEAPIYPQTSDSTITDIPDTNPEMAIVEEKKKKSPLKWIILAVLVVAVAVGGFFGYKYFVGGDDQSDIKSKKLIEMKELDPESVTVMELYPDREVSSGDIKAFAGVIEERVAILGENYVVEYDSEKITLTIEKTMLGETATERMSTVELLLSRGNVAFGLNEYVYYDSPEKSGIKEIAVEKLERADFLADNKIGFIDKRYEQIEAIRTDEIFGLKITFDTASAELMEELTKDAYGEPKLTAMHDFIEENRDEEKFFGTVVFAQDNDFSVVYVVNSGASYEKNTLLMKKILEQDAMKFGLVAESLDEPIWETEGKRMGKNQVKSMDGFTVSAAFNPDKFSREYNKETDYAEFESLIKRRMDVLGINYMFGTTGFDDKTFCVRLDSKEFTPDFFRLIFGSRSISVNSSFGRISGFSSPELVEKDGKIAIRVENYNTFDEIMKDNTIADNAVYLVVNDVTVANADITLMEENEEGNFIYFTNFPCFGNREATEDDKNILELICAIADDTYHSFSGSFTFHSYDDGNSAEDLTLGDLEWKYSPLTSQDEIVFGIINDLGCDVEKKSDSRNSIIITILDVEVNEQLPVNFLEKIKTVYAACNFEGGAYNEVTFVIKDEKKESPANEYRVVVRKDTYDKKMEASLRATGPKYSTYWYDTYTIMQEDPFYVALKY